MSEKMGKKMSEKTGKKINEKGILAWAKELKHNEKFAKKFEGVKTVKDILSVAKQSGYEFSEQELVDFDLDSVAGGALGADVRANLRAGIFTDVKNKKNELNVINAKQVSTATGQEAIAYNQGNINIGK